MKFNYLKMFIAVTAIILLTSVPAGASQMDEDIISSAQKSYVFETFLKDDSIKIKSTQGDVVLTGTVAQQSHLSLAKETVANLPGVKSVDNQLVVKGPAEESDLWISMQIKYSLLYNRHVSGLNTQVFVTEGIVTLRGEAQNQAQKELAGEYAKDIKGVKDVKNEMTIAKVPSETKQTMGEKIDDASITAQVKMAFLTHHSTSSFKTGVETRDGVVTLTGVADSAAGKSISSKVASDVNGVVSVVNNMMIKDLITKNRSY